MTECVKNGYGVGLEGTKRRTVWFCGKCTASGFKLCGASSNSLPIGWGVTFDDPVGTWDSIILFGELVWFQLFGFIALQFQVD